MNVDLDVEKAVEEIKRIKAERVLLQLPDGLKPKAHEIVDVLEEKTDAKVTIWLGSCFGSCDLPSGKEIEKFDLVIAYGHSRWKF